MSYSNEIYRLAKLQLEERRMNAERLADEHRAEVYAKFPQAQMIENKIASCGILAVRAVITGKDASTQMKNLKEQNLALQMQLKNLLISNGYGENYFEPQYFCNFCKDTGYIEKNNKTIYCNCFKRLLVATACDELNRKAPLALSTFASFDLNKYSQINDAKLKVSPYSNMLQIYNYCLEYSRGFNPTKSKNILMRGGTGLGKTHLSLAIANEVIRRGFGVIYVSAPALMAKIEKVRFSKDEESSYTDMLTNCDLLIIDDLGTEFRTQFSTSQFYNLCNSRLLLRKPFIINTNLTIAELEKTYSQRFISRMFESTTSILNFFGDDIRMQR